jgi:hypothetical protein
MLADELLFITSKEFCDVVRALKRMHPQINTWRYTPPNFGTMNICAIAS